jgi:hypothetical protein
MTRTTQFALAALLLAVAGLVRPLPCAAAGPAAFDSFLSRTTALVSGLLDEFSDVKCTERVSQEKLGKNGKVEYKADSTYDYLVILSNAGGELTLDESRVEQEQARHKKQVPLLVTNGFAMGFLVFHPYYANSFEFRDDGDETAGGKLLRKVHFRHVRGTRSPTALSLRGREYPLELEGDAWIDPTSGAITRMVSGIPVGIEDLGLHSLRSEVEYAPVSFHDAGKPPWLPVTATIEVETARQHWRNTHRFSDYKRFSVSTQENVNEGSIKR